MGTAGVLFVVTCLIYVYPYLIYPLILRILCSGRPDVPRGGTRHVERVTHIICAHNEEADIEAKLANALEVRTRAAHEIVLVCDGCTDRTVEIANALAEKHPRLTVMEVPHMGKSAAQNHAVRETASDVIVFSDADTVLGEDTIELLLQSLEAGYACVGANVQYGQKDTPDSVYNRLEAKLKTLQGRLGVLIGVHGACYAVRREDFVELSSSVLSDLALPLEILLKGGRVGFETEAVVHEISERGDFRRNLATRRRIFCRAMVTLLAEGYVARFFARPGLFFHLVSDKVPRSFIGALSLVLLLLAMILGGWVLRAVAAFILIVGVSMLLAAPGEKPGRAAKLGAASTFFITVNLASLLALWDFIRGEDYSRW
jgi:cellulose synthase/poly-beta-1,6-N-acetylglucosamine synthase-like glycosyltransferase